MHEILSVSLILLFIFGVAYCFQLAWYYLFYGREGRDERMAALVQKKGGVLKGGVGEFFKDEVGVRARFVNFRTEDGEFPNFCDFVVQANLIFRSNYCLINSTGVIIGDKLVGSVNNYRLFKSYFSKGDQQFEQDLLRVLTKIRKIAPRSFYCRLSKTETCIRFSDSDGFLPCDDAFDYAFELFLNIKSISSPMIECVDFNRVQRNAMWNVLYTWIGVIVGFLGFMSILYFIVEAYY